MTRKPGTRTASAHAIVSDDCWRLTDRTTGRTLAGRASVTLRHAVRKRARLIELAAAISPECGEDGARRCDIRKVGA